MSTPKFDLVIFGATSFVGQILAKYLLATFNKEGQEKLTWAFAGRSEPKLNALKFELGDQASDIEIIIADASDENALSNMCRQAKVIVSTVGPYALYGEPLVKACAETGTDYCDLTGEVQWIKRMVTKYEHIAKQSGARIVNCCGFDSIPSDMGVYFLQQQAQTKFNSHCNTVKMRVKAAKGGASGGTVASMVNITKEAVADPALRKELANPYSICPENHGFTARQHNVKTTELDSDLNAWAAPFIMSGINTRVVHRSNALSGNSYGKDFKYDEAMLAGRGFKGRIRANIVVAGLAGFMAGVAIKPSRWALEKFVLPKPGEGPTPSEQVNGYYDLRFVGTSPSGDKIKTKVTGKGDPGYGSTSKMLGQAAAYLALDLKSEDKDGGFWTPATIFDDRFLNRLTEKADLNFEVID